ncbi:MAG: hypothetical protein WBX15_10810 [Thermoanaerobaculia bacterium]
MIRSYSFIVLLLTMITGTAIAAHRRPVSLGLEAGGFSAVRTETGIPEEGFNLDSVVSGDVTLVRWGYYDQKFILVDAAGRQIGSVEDLPSGIITNYDAVPVPGGFELLWLDFDGGFSPWGRRVALDGAWVDPGALPLQGMWDATAGGWDDEMLFAERAPEGIRWQRISTSGKAVDQPPRAEALAQLFPDHSMAIAGNGDDRLILLQESPRCSDDCTDLPRLIVLALGRDGAPLGLHRTFEPVSSKPLAAGLPDGTWVVPVGAAETTVLHLSPDGEELERSRVPLLDHVVTATADSSGWKVIADHPIRLIRLDGADRAISVTALPDVALPRFGYGDLLVFADEADFGSPEWRPSVRPLAMVPGDISLSVQRFASSDPSVVWFEVSVRNDGTSTVSNIRVGGKAAGQPAIEIRIPTIEPGGERRLWFTMPLSEVPSTIIAAAEGVEDLTPEDNFVEPFSGEEKPPSRRHGVAGPWH